MASFLEDLTAKISGIATRLDEAIAHSRAIKASVDANLPVKFPDPLPDVVGPKVDALTARIDSLESQIKTHGAQVELLSEELKGLGVLVK